MRRFIIDTDTASDDAVALMMAMRYPDVQVDAITVVAGNVDVKQASKNARYVRELMGYQVPVFNGCDGPILRKLEIADWFHGSDGMGNQHYPVPAQPPEAEHAANALVRLFNESPQEITLVTLGPLTNIATALMLDPNLSKCVKHCYVMGGAANIEGNVTPAAEYNIWVDPESAYKVLHSGIPITMLGWELSRGDSTLSDSEINEIKLIGTEAAKVAMNCNMHALNAVREIQGEAGLALADPCAMAVALDPTVATNSSQHFVDISLDTTVTRGMTVVDKLNVTGKKPNATVCYAINSNKWKSILKSSLA